jgi:ribulose kinase
MRSAKVLIGAAALAALAAGRARLARPSAEHAEQQVDAEDLVDAEENVSELREQLRSELARLASADIKASRSRREPTSPPG